MPRMEQAAFRAMVLPSRAVLHLGPWGELTSGVCVSAGKMDIGFEVAEARTVKRRMVWVWCVMFCDFRLTLAP